MKEDVFMKCDIKSLARRALSLALCAVMALALVPAAQAASVTPTASTNAGAQEYVNGRRWASTVKSYLYPNSIGGLTRVEYTGGKILVEDYDSQFRAQASRSIPLELSIWGGFFAGENYNFLVFGQNNEEENDSKEVVRIVKYSKDWQRLGSVSLYGANTIHPFAAGSVRFAEHNGYLYVHTCHEMYASSDGRNHQASVMILIRESDMKITDSAYEVGGVAYTSHSFNQYILIDQDRNILALDHGDAYPRSITLQRLIAKAGQDSFHESKRVPAEQPGWYYTVYEDTVDVRTFPGGTGVNDTGAAVGGFAETSNGYVTAYNYDGTASNLGTDPRDIYLAFTDKSLSKTNTVKVSNDFDTSVPQLVSTGLDSGYILWNGRSSTNWYSASIDSNLYYARYDANGNVGAVQTIVDGGALSDCAPICWNGKVVWYTTKNSVPTFYLLDSSGVASRQASAGTGSPADIAYANTQTVLLDGKRVEFQTYALKDSAGGVTNYIKLRDMACYLNGTRAQFSVDWSAAQGISLTTGKPYTPNGSELSTPFSGNRAYKAGTGKTTINSAAYSIPTIILADDNGGAYTYYKLRDMGQYLGFNVSYINGQVVVNTNEPYSDAQ